jgi:hypothetical protein
MVLLISAARNAAECAAAIEKDLGESVELISAISQSAAKLRSAEYAAIVVDQSMVDAHPASADTLWKHAGTAIPIFISFAISGVERIVRDVRSALTRRRQEQLLAARAAQAALRNELAGAVSGILLSSELALAQPALPASIADKLRSVHELALQIQSRLGSAA